MPADPRSPKLLEWSLLWPGSGRYLLEFRGLLWCLGGRVGVGVGAACRILWLDSLEGDTQPPPLKLCSKCSEFGSESPPLWPRSSCLFCRLPLWFHARQRATAVPLHGEFMGLAGAHSTVSRGSQLQEPVRSLSTISPAHLAVSRPTGIHPLQQSRWGPICG